MGMWSLKGRYKGKSRHEEGERTGGVEEHVPG